DLETGDVVLRYRLRVVRILRLRARVVRAGDAVRDERGSRRVGRVTRCRGLALTALVGLSTRSAGMWIGGEGRSDPSKSESEDGWEAGDEPALCCTFSVERS